MIIFKCPKSLSLIHLDSCCCTVVILKTGKRVKMDQRMLVNSVTLIYEPHMLNQAVIE